MNKTFSKKGFTLIEILIVVAIIAILASSVLVGFGPAQRQGRDARRISDLRQVQNALELYYSKCGYYPGPVQAGTSCSGAFSQTNTWAGLTTVLTGSGIGINQVPDDPTNGKHYTYGSANGSGYVLAADLEQTGNSALQASPKGGSIEGVDWNVVDLQTEKMKILRLREKIADKAVRDKRFIEKATFIITQWLQQKKK